MSMTILQVSWCDSVRDIRQNYAAAFDGIAERLSAPMAEYVFLDSMEQAEELKARIVEHVPRGCQPYIQAFFSCQGTAREHWSAIVTQLYC